MAVDIYCEEKEKYIKKFLVESWEKKLRRSAHTKNDERHTIVVRKGVELFVVTFMIGDGGGGGGVDDDDGVGGYSNNDDIGVSSISTIAPSCNETNKQTSRNGI